MMSRRGGPPIESPSNPTVRMLRELHTREGRREHRAFLVEGTRLVAEAVLASWPLTVTLYDPVRAGQDPALAELVSRIPNAVQASSRAIKHASDTVTPQGIVAAAAMPPAHPSVDPAETLALILDGIADPGNAGSLLRSALGAGVRTVITSRHCVDLFSPKVVRGGMGAHFHLKLAVEVSWTGIRRMLGQAREVVVAEARAPLAYHRYDWRRPAALVVGGEARGPSPEALKMATARVCIPLEPEVESLNAAVAGSVIVFEAKRQREEASGREAERRE